MQQSCTYGSVRGALGNRRPYRDRKPVIKDFFLHALFFESYFRFRIMSLEGSAYPPRPACGSHASWTARFRMRTRLYAAAAKVNIHPTRSFPRNFTLRNPPTVFIHPKISSTRFRFC